VSGSSTGDAYQPALDGVRALAVVLVLLFHLDVGWMPGGYLGVSVFFTLSGFLITRVLIGEVASTGTVRLGRFYQRRLRRLAPASLLTLAMVVVLVQIGVFEASRDLRNEIAASALQSLNLYDIVDGSSYAELFREPSPVAHFWSLGVEEQFYWVWPVVFVGLCVGLRRRPDRLVTAMSALFVLASLSAVVTAQISPSAAYYAPWSRSAEILAGAVLAAWIAEHGVSRHWRRLALPALLAIVVVSALTPTGRGWAYDGGLPVFAIGSVALIAGLQRPDGEAPDGLASRMLTQRPVVALGAISYGVYLLHWPIFVAMTPTRTGIDGVGLDVARVAATIVLAAVMYRVLERPIRFPTAPTGLRPVVVAAGSATLGVVLFAALAVTSPSPAPEAARVIGAAPVTTAPAERSEPAVDGAERPPRVVTDDDRAASNRTPSAAPGAAGVDDASAAEPPHVLGIVGDSVPAWMLRDGAPWFDRTDVVIVNVSREACDGMPDLPLGRDRHGVELRPPDTCTPWTTWYDEAIAESGLDMDTALLVLGQAPTVDRLIDGAWRGPCDGIDWYLADLDERFAFLRQRGIEPVFALPAPPGDRARYVLPDDAPARVDCIRTQLRTFLEDRSVRTIDLAEIMCPEGDCERIRSDGTHVDPDKAIDVLDWVVDRSLAAH
jgi:peptidoglycan/LPS O-acetylase OafA/YrhL